MNLTVALSALAQPTRRGLFEAIANATGGITPTELADATGTMPTNTSAHLTVLRNAGLVTASRRGKTIIYRAVPETIRSLVRHLDRLAR